MSEYDLLVVGGGINGAGIAHLAQDHGIKTVLIEKGDFDVVMYTLNFITGNLDSTKKLIEVCKKNQVALIAIKTFAGCRWSWSFVSNNFCSRLWANQTNRFAVLH